MVQFHGTLLSFTRTSFSKVSHLKALKVKVQTIAHAQYPLMHDRLVGECLHALTDIGSNPELLVQPRA